MNREIKEIKRWADIVKKAATPLNGKNLTQPEISALIQCSENLNQQIQYLKKQI
jgi:hypothetical protein